MARRNLRRACVIEANKVIQSLKLPFAFEWSSLQFDKNATARLQTDRNNEGLSLVIVLGDFKGGALRVSMPPGHSPSAMFIDGREKHISVSFKGLRYSIVAFVHESARGLSPMKWRQLRRL